MTSFGTKEKTKRAKLAGGREFKFKLFSKKLVQK